MLASSDPRWLQWAFNSLVGLFEHVGLRTNVGKTVSMTCRPCPAAGNQLEVAYGRKMTGEGHRWDLPVLYYHKMIVIYPYPFLVAITQLFSWIIFINYCICILTSSPVYYILMIIYVIQKNGGNKNFPDSLNVMVNYHYHS